MDKTSRWKAAYRLLKYGLYAPKIKPENIYPKYFSSILGLQNSKTLDLGCGGTPRNPFKAENFYGVDLFEQSDQNIEVADLTISPIPFANNTFNYITAYDFIEHIPRVLYSPSRSFPFINLMSEIFRCLKPGGYFFSHTPAYPNHLCSGIQLTLITLQKKLSAYILIM